ncbi:pleckstrin homology domain-containing family O member 2-like [Xenia sp. Carnegie-2017]|uniref:pleckstrin homology domain-containing family O member 2-like n=1 Tax=Xenia sp. Carnegie-2017 TaxID=2897299 RepID=UPI001F03500B|nr:pleckstrin homology domain-containing family O member 2-like [Xenia sp. Carnegie-2017]
MKMVDVSNTESGSPKKQAQSNLTRKWMSEPNLLERSMEDGTWVRRTENMDEEGISFMEEVPKLQLEHINKDRVKMRPKRRPPSRAFVKSQASLDFDFVISEDIKEDDEEESTKVEHTDLHTEEANENLSDDSETPKTSLVKPTPPPKPLSKLNKKIPGPKEVNTEIANENHSDDAETPQTSPIKPTPPPKPFSKLNKKIPGPIEVNTEITNENLSDDGETPQTSPVKPARPPKPSGGWKLPSPTTGFKLRKTSEGEETKDDNEASDRITNAKERTSSSSSPEKNIEISNYRLNHRSRNFVEVVGVNTKTTLKVILTTKQT